MTMIACVDDDRNILTSLQILLETEGFEVEVFTDPVAALQSFQNRPPDLAVLDIKMPRLNGLDMFRRIRQTSDLPLIFLTSKDEEVDEEIGLRLGADDYIKKPFSQRLLVERIRAVLRRRAPSDDLPGSDAERSFRCGDLMINPARHACSWKDQPIQLTVTEFLILRALAERPGHVRKREQLIEAAYSDNVYVDDRTIDSHIKRIRKKFRVVDSGFSEIQTLYGIGYRYGNA